MKNFFLKIKNFIKKLDSSIDNMIEKLASKCKGIFLNWRSVIVCFVFVALGLMIRFALVHYPSNDYLTWLQKWTYYIKINGGFLKGLKALFMNTNKVMAMPGITESTGVPDCYPPLYMYFLSIVALFPEGKIIGVGSNGLYYENIMIGIKIISFISDILIAVFAYKIVKKVTNDEVRSLTVFVVIMIAPTIFVNSGLWGQCDSVLALTLVLSVYMMIQNKQIRSMLFFGLAFGLKMQAIFLLPLFGYLWFLRKFKLRYMLFAPLAVLLTFVPLLLVGTSFKSLFASFTGQLKGFQALNLNSTSLFTLFSSYTSNRDVDTNKIWANAGMVICVLSCFMVITFLALKKVKVTPLSIVGTSTIFAILVPLTLPHMHERYFFFADVMTIIYACSFKAKKRFYLPMFMQMSSMIAYTSYGIVNSQWLFEEFKSGNINDNLKIGTILNIVILSIVLCDMFALDREE